MDYIIIVVVGVLLAVGTGKYVNKKNLNKIKLLIDVFVKTLDEDLDEDDLDAVIRHILEKLLRAPESTEELEKEVTAKVLEVRQKEKE